MPENEPNEVQSRRWLLCDSCGLLFAQPTRAARPRPAVCRACQSSAGEAPEASTAPLQARDSFDGGWLLDVPNGEPRGPLTLNEVKGLIRAEGLTGDVRVWSVGLLDWPRLDQLPVFDDVLAEVRRRPQTAPIAPVLPPIPTPNDMPTDPVAPKAPPKVAEPSVAEVPAPRAAPPQATPAPPSGTGPIKKARITGKLRAERVRAKEIRQGARDDSFRAPKPGAQRDEPSVAELPRPLGRVTPVPRPVSVPGPTATPGRRASQRAALAPAVARPVNNLIDQAEAALLAQRLPAARQYLLRALQLAPAYLPALRLMGLHDLCSRKINMAEVMLEKAHGLDEQDAETLLCMGVFHWQRGAHARARSHWRRALLHDPALKLVVDHGGAGHPALELFPDALAGFQALVRR